MRGRRPHLISLSDTDRAELQRLVKSGKTEQRVARRARILLALELPQTRVVKLSKSLGITRAAIWELTRRYEERGIKAIYDAPRSGRPKAFQPFRQKSNKSGRILKASRRRAGKGPIRKPVE